MGYGFLLGTAQMLGIVLPRVIPSVRQFVRKACLHFVLSDLFVAARLREPVRVQGALHFGCGCFRTIIIRTPAFMVIITQIDAWIVLQKYIYRPLPSEVVSIGRWETKRSDLLRPPESSRPEKGVLSAYSHHLRSWRLTC